MLKSVKEILQLPFSKNPEARPRLSQIETPCLPPGFHVVNPSIPDKLDQIAKVVMGYISPNDTEVTAVTAET